MSITLAGCFRDASRERGNPTTIPINEFVNQPTRTIIPTLTSTPERPPTNTFPVGGPPLDTSTETAPNTPDLPPTLPIPSFTPASGNRFGDSGITPTAFFPTPPVPNSLITPTGLAAELNECIHVVQPNETLFSIATEIGVTIDDMVAFNPVLASDPNALQIGQQLVIPNCTPASASAASDAKPSATAAPTSAETAASATPTAASAVSGTTYTVKEGDTLFRIALQFNTTVDAIVAANGLGSQDAIIFPGQVLTIPQP